MKQQNEIEYDLIHSSKWFAIGCAILTVPLILGQAYELKQQWDVDSGTNEALIRGHFACMEVMRLRKEVKQLRNQIQIYQPPTNAVPSRGTNQ